MKVLDANIIFFLRSTSVGWSVWGKNSFISGFPDCINSKKQLGDRLVAVQGSELRMDQIKMKTE